MFGKSNYNMTWIVPLSHFRKRFCVQIYFRKLLFLAGDFMLEVLFLYSGSRTKNVSRELRWMINSGINQYLAESGLKRAAWFPSRLTIIRVNKIEEGNDTRSAVWT